MAERRAKRPKIERCEDDYLPGNITEIELHNFMTFDNLTCKPGSRLNLVIGPNGSGKSSLVCAIALCLGGEPQLLGRASSIGAFVKRGEESGYVKISLRGQTVNEHIIIMRKIDTRNKSEWLLNGKLIPKKEITDVIQRFNIQVNNLTQFLPQDRVCEFAKLNPIQLLEETEKAVGDPELPVKHRALVEKSCELKKHENAVERNGETLKQLMALNAEQEKDVERVRQKEELLTKVDSMKKKLPWLKYDMKKAVFMEAKGKSEEAKKQLDEAAIALNELKNPIEMEKNEKALIETKCKKISGFINDNASERASILREESHAVVKINDIKKKMEDFKKEEASRHQRILKVREELHAAQLHLENLPLYEPPREEFERLRGEILELRLLISSKKSQKLEKEKLLGQKKQTLRQCVDRLKDMENATTKVLHVLRNSGAEKIHDAYNWLQQHRNQLSKEVYGPLLLEVNVSDQQHASYLEGHLPHYVWKSFITQDSCDRDFMVKNMNSFGVPILNYVKDESNVRPPFQISKEMHELGIYSRLDQIFDAPTVVKEVLTSQFGLDSSYIGQKETDQNAVDVSKLGIFDFWTPESHYRWSVSRYGGHTSASVDAVGPARLLLSGADIGEMDKLRSRKNELEESIAADEESLKHLQTEQRVLEIQYANLEKQREEIHKAVQEEKKRRRELQDRAEQKIKWLESQEKEDNLDIVMAKHIEEVASLNEKRFGYAITLKDLIGEAVGLKLEFAGKHLTSIEHSAKICEMEGSLKQQEKFAEQVAMRVEYCKKEVEECKQQLADAKRHAESIAVITPELEKAFLEMPGTIEELDAAIHDCISEANSIYFLNQNILQEYECRQNEIKALSAKLEADKENVRRCLAEINTLNETWLPTLRNLVSQINETFSHNFQEMAVAGEVSLDEHETDFNQFGILIKVKFRQSGQLQVLSAHHQSGGERSVSTILYLVSLQDLTNCPFRVVDEINQGMDPINERKMFQQLVRAASQPNTPQCFLLTPKLLPDLEYSEACSILNIMNGPWIEQPSKVWSSGKSWRSITGLVEESRC